VRVHHHGAGFPSSAIYAAPNNDAAAITRGRRDRSMPRVRALGRHPSLATWNRPGQSVELPDQVLKLETSGRSPNAVRQNGTSFRRKRLKEKHLPRLLNVADAQRVGGRRRTPCRGSYPVPRKKGSAPPAPRPRLPNAPFERKPLVNEGHLPPCRP